MKTIIVTLLISLSTAAFSAAPPEPVYPPIALAFEKLSFKTVPQKKLPAGVNFWAAQGAESNEDPDYKGNVCYLDINRDGTEEIIVESDAARTSQYEVWQKRKGRWISLLTVWGRPDFLRPHNGYYQITVWNEDRRGEGMRELYVFKGVRYHLIRMDQYRGDTFVGSADVREREQILEGNFKQQLRE